MIKHIPDVNSNRAYFQCSECQRTWRKEPTNHICQRVDLLGVGKLVKDTTGEDIADILGNGYEEYAEFDNPKGGDYKCKKSIRA